MNIAVLWFGRQGKKHAHLWSQLGYCPVIFTRHHTQMTLSIDLFQPTEYSIIIVAISPLEEQDRMIEWIFKENYEGYLIIEKPVTHNLSLLEKLKNRKKTVFFIDEAYLPLSITWIFPLKIFTICPLKESHISIQEHAIWLFLPQSMNRDFYACIEYACWVGEDMSYVIETNKWKFEFMSKKLFFNWNNIKFNFYYVYMNLIWMMKDEARLKNIRENYWIFKNY